MHEAEIQYYCSLNLIVFIVYIISSITSNIPHIIDLTFISVHEHIYGRSVEGRAKTLSYSPLVLVLWLSKDVRELN